MAEPTTTTGSAGLLTLLVVLFGPLAGPYVFVVFGALVGAATALSELPASTRASGALYLVRVMFMSLLFSAPLATILGGYAPVNSEAIMGGTAYLIGWKFDAIASKAWPALMGRVLGALRGSKEG